MFWLILGVVKFVALLVHSARNACLIGEVRVTKPVLMSIAAPFEGWAVSAITLNAHVLVCLMVL